MAETCTNEQLVQAVVQHCQPGVQLQDIPALAAQLVLLPADEKGEIDEDCPALETRVPVHQFGITSFALQPREGSTMSTASLEPPSAELRIGACSKAALTSEARFFFAAENGQLDVVRSMMESSAIDVNATGIDKWSALHFAARKGHLNVVNFLLVRGAEVDSCTKSGWSPLHMAVWSGHADVAEVLINCGAHVNARDSKNKTCLYYAKQNQSQNAELLEILKDNGAVE